MRGPHDVGGLDFGPIDTTPHDMTFWEKQIERDAYPARR